MARTGLAPLCRVYHQLRVVTILKVDSPAFTIGSAARMKSGKRSEVGGERLGKTIGHDRLSERYHVA